MWSQTDSVMLRSDHLLQHSLFLLSRRFLRYDSVFRVVMMLQNEFENNLSEGYCEMSKNPNSEVPKTFVEFTMCCALAFSTSWTFAISHVGHCLSNSGCLAPRTGNPGERVVSLKRHFSETPLGFWWHFPSFVKVPQGIWKIPVQIDYRYFTWPVLLVFWYLHQLFESRKIISLYRNIAT